MANIHTYTYIHSLSYIIFHHVLSQESGSSSLGCTVRPHCLSILNVIICIYWPQLPVHSIGLIFIFFYFLNFWLTLRSSSQAYKKCWDLTWWVKTEYPMLGRYIVVKVKTERHSKKIENIFMVIGTLFLNYKDLNFAPNKESVINSDSWFHLEANAIAKRSPLKPSSWTNFLSNWRASPFLKQTALAQTCFGLWLFST